MLNEMCETWRTILGCYSDNVECSMRKSVRAVASHKLNYEIGTVARLHWPATQSQPGLTGHSFLISNIFLQAPAWSKSIDRISRLSWLIARDVDRHLDLQHNRIVPTRRKVESISIYFRVLDALQLIRTFSASEQNFLFCDETHLPWSQEHSPFLR